MYAIPRGSMLLQGCPGPYLETLGRCQYTLDVKTIVPGYAGQRRQILKRSLSKPNRGISCVIEMAFMSSRDQVAVMNIKEVLSAPRSPWQRAYVERVIGSFVVHNKTTD